MRRARPNRWRRAAAAAARAQVATLNDIVHHGLNWVIPPSEKALIAKLQTLKRTVHFKAFHPDRAARSGMGVEEATTMAAWIEQVGAPSPWLGLA